jgi:hypothetical protein
MTMTKKRKTDPELWARLNAREQQLRELVAKGEADLARKRAEAAQQQQ